MSSIPIGYLTRHDPHDADRPLVQQPYDGRLSGSRRMPWYPSCMTYAQERELRDAVAVLLPRMVDGQTIDVPSTLPLSHPSGYGWSVERRKGTLWITVGTSHDALPLDDDSLWCQQAWYAARCYGHLTSHYLYILSTALATTEAEARS